MSANIPSLKQQTGGEMEHIEDTGSIEKGNSRDHESEKGLDLLHVAAAQEKRLNTFQAIRTYKFAFAWAMFLSIGACMSGFDSSVAGGVLSVPAFRQDQGFLYAGGYVIAASWQSAANASAQIGKTFGAAACGYIAEKLGRKGAILLASIISIGTIPLEVFVLKENMGMFLAGRLLNSFANGIYGVIASNYAVEVSPLPLRGITTGGVNLWIAFGQFLSSVVIKTTGLRTDQWSYRIPLAVQWFFPVVMLVGLPFIPESPWFLVRKGNEEGAKHSLHRLLKGSGTDEELHLKMIKETIELEERENHTQANARWVDLFKGTNARRTMIAGMVFVLQEGVGVQFVLGYSVYFFELAGFSVNNSFQLGIGTLALAIVGNLIGLSLITIVGRRSLFLVGMVLCTFDCLMIGILGSPKNSPGAVWGMGIFTMLYMLFYQSTIGPLAYAIYAEVPNAALRTKTISFGVGVNQISALVINVINPYMVNPNEGNMQGKVGWVFGGFGVVGTIWTYFFLPEIKGRTVDELDQLFELRVSSRKFGSYKLD